MSDRAEVDRLVMETLRHYGRIDILINNAGVMSVGDEPAMQLEDYEKSLQTHFWGPYYTINAVLPYMKAQSSGRIVNISSIGGKISVPHMLPYSAGKFALVGLSEGMHSTLRKEGVKVTTVVPGLMRTGSPRNVTVKGAHEEEYAWFKIADSLPFSSMDPERAAVKILMACRRGDAALILTLSAKLMTALHGLFPGFTGQVLSTVTRFLPESQNTTAKKGYEVESAASQNALTESTDEQAYRNNEY
ncbi:MAG: SDR family oxidoreductase [Bacteroidia bacterium]|nr:SDR family oxidoreductase [Bacteroidia bacterium]